MRVALLVQLSPKRPRSKWLVATGAGGRKNVYFERRIAAAAALFRAGMVQYMALCRAADELAEAGIRLREGPLDAPQLRSRLAVLRYGEAVVARAEAHRTARRP